MEVLVWIGAALALLGIAGLVWSAALRAQMARALPLNIGALLLSFLGLMCVLMGVLLG